MIFKLFPIWHANKEKESTHLCHIEFNLFFVLPNYIVLKEIKLGKMGLTFLIFSPHT